jgi:uncharacterized protein DUF5989
LSFLTQRRNGAAEAAVISLRRRAAARETFQRMSKLYVISELWQFMRENKKFWLAPIIITLVAVGVLLVLAKGSAIAPFIYTLF